MSIFSSYKKIFLLGFIVAILIAIPFSVYIAQKRQGIKSKATASTTLSLDPATPTVKVGDTLTLNVMLDPGIGPSANQVSFVKLSISFNAEKFTAESLKPNMDSQNALTSVLEDVALTSGKASISLSIGADPTKVVTTKTKIAILKLKALSPTESNNPSSIIFDSSPNTQVLSIATSDQTSENVLSTSNPATVTISGTASITPIPTSVAGSPARPSTLTPITTPSPSSGGFTGTMPVGLTPVCSSLSTDNLIIGTAPYSLTFTASGSDPDGTISKISFNFGDGPVQVLTSGGGIGTSSVSGQLAHTFTTPGTYTVYSILTDNNDNLNPTTESCTKTITINPVGFAGENGEAIPPPVIALPPTGPSENIFGIGAIGVILTIIGGALFIFL